MLRAAPGEEAFAAALDWAVASSRWRVAAVLSILAAGTPGGGAAQCPVRSARWPTTPGQAAMTAYPSFHIGIAFDAPSKPCFNSAET